VERDLLETGRAMGQTISRLQREVATLRRRSGWTGTAIREALPTPVTVASGGEQATLLEFDVSPGRWFVSYRGTMRVTAAAFTGQEEAELYMSVRPQGSGLASQMVVEEMKSGTSGGDVAVIGRAEYRLSGFDTVESEEGLTLRLYGAARDHANISHSATWYGAVMIAMPL